jgi:hypothetical protein
VKKVSLINRVRQALRLSDAPVESKGPEVEIPRKITIVGSSGTDISAGQFFEEYLFELRGTQAARVWDKMRRSDGKVKMVLSAVKNPLRSATWEIEAAGDSPEAILQKEFVEHCLFSDMDKDFSETLNESLTMVEFGFSVLEETHKVVLNHPKFGAYNGIRSLGFRSQKTIERWNLDPSTGKIISVSQYAYGDLGKIVDIPGEFLVVFSLDKEGDNYEGISLLRPCYGAWKRKNTYLKLNAIGIEKFAVPAPVLTVPSGKWDTDEYDRAVEILEAYTSHESAYITLPEGWKVDFIKNDFDPARVQGSVDAENKEIVFAFLANFLELGMTGGGGSYALGNDLSDFFLGGIEYIGQQVCGQFNRGPIKRLIDMKFGPQAKYPTLKVSGISDKAGKEFAEILGIFGTGKYITPDDSLEDHLRKRLGIPKRSNVGVRVVNPPLAPTPAPVTPMSEGRAQTIKLAEKAALKQIRAAKESVGELMRGKIKEIGGDLIEQITQKAKGLPESQWTAVTKQVAPKGAQDYKAALKDALAGIAVKALEQARREVPKAKAVKLSEPLGSIQLSEFDKLPAQVKKRIQAQTDLIVDSQFADVEKALYFQFQSSAASTDSVALIGKDLAAKLEIYIDGTSVTSAVGNVVSLVINDARNAFFFDDDVKDEIEAYMFVNADPDSEICKDLAGTVFAKDDPESERYLPPLHHNCESYLVPILKGAGYSRPVDPNGLKPSSPELEKFITL